MFQTKVVQKIETHILCSVSLSRKFRRLWGNRASILSLHLHCPSCSFQISRSQISARWPAGRPANLTLHFQTFPQSFQYLIRRHILSNLLLTVHFTKWR